MIPKIVVGEGTFLYYFSANLINSNLKYFRNSGNNSPALVTRFVTFLYTGFSPKTIFMYFFKLWIPDIILNQIYIHKCFYWLFQAVLSEVVRKSKVDGHPVAGYPKP